MTGRKRKGWAEVRGQRTEDRSLEQVEGEEGNRRGEKERGRWGDGEKEKGLGRGQKLGGTQGTEASRHIGRTGVRGGRGDGEKEKGLGRGQRTGTWGEARHRGIEAHRHKGKAGAKG